MHKFTIVYQKILSVSFGKLLLIVVFRILRLLTDKFEKVLLQYSKNAISFSWRHKIVSQIWFQSETYYRLCVFDGNTINQANKILEGKILLFGKEFLISDSSWLCDPITKKQWPSNIYFADTKVEEKGLGDVKYVMELNKMYHLVILSQAYAITKEQKYINTIKQQLISWKNIVKYEHSIVNKSMLDIVYRCYNLIHVCMLCNTNSEFQEKVLPIIIEILLLSERQIRKFSTPRWCKYSTGANHTIGEMAGLITIQQYLQYFTNKNYDKYLKTEYRYLNRSLDTIITNQGVYLEQSANYSKLVAEFLIMLDIFVKAKGTEFCLRLYREDYLRKLLDYTSTLSYAGKFPNYGDNDGAKATTPFYKSFDSVEHLINYRKLRFPNDECKQWLLCEKSGQFIWKSPNNEFYLFTRCGKHSFLPLGSGSHAHNDMLSFCVNVKGQELIIDYGTLYYNSGIDIINQDRATAVHNTLSIEGVEQAAFAGKWLYSSYPKSYINTEETVIHEEGFSFMGCCEYAGRKHSRKLFFNNAKLQITDNVICNDDDIISLHFVLSPKVKVLLEGGKMDFYIDKEMVASLISNPAITISVDNIGYHPSYGMTENTIMLTLKSNKKGSQEIKTEIIITR